MFLILSSKTSTKISPAVDADTLLPCALADRKEKINRPLSEKN
jgi:hypothetical protein